MPNKKFGVIQFKQGLKYKLLMRVDSSGVKGITIYGVFIAIVNICHAQKHKPREGWLTSNGKADGTPMTASDIAADTLVLDVPLVQLALDTLGAPPFEWLECFDDKPQAKPKAKPNAAKKVEANPECTGFATKLAEIVQKKINIKCDIRGWVDSFRLLAGRDGVSPERITKALDWYADNIGGDYIPVAHSGLAFRKKFSKIEAAMSRKEPSKPKKPSEHAGGMEAKGGVIYGVCNCGAEIYGHPDNPEERKAGKATALCVKCGETVTLQRGE